jgi:hypothetical protein
MGFKKILEEQANVDSVKFIAKYAKESDRTKIIIEGWGVDSDRYVDFFLQYEEIEDFYYFIKEVKELTA